MGDEEAETLRLVALVAALKRVEAPVYVSLFTPMCVAPHLDVAYVSARVHNAATVCVFGDWFVCSFGLVPATDVERAAWTLVEVLSPPRS
ncbi:hypothetical protein GCM10009678_26560 [Actinomadura kijaniata]|uniref:Uncharacterized protein n=1 Tax=Actinomadura namibiensis TaxID=182080 RepID=A0A7W3LUU4_ACTNM|nr:hypothetical protein [Actinomadura namibiensis]MBA8954645.1 hypothetical protein [Actinomadura namibiensis]